MSHPEQMAFIQAVAEANQKLVAGGSVLEIGSFDVNGSVRCLFGDCGEYVGVDLSEGPGVDVVSFGHEVDLPAESFDVAVSGECFEHDPHWAATFTNMVRLTRPGGVVAFTCASRGRPEHGTRRTRRDESPGTQAVGIDYYRNLVETDFSHALPLEDWFETHRFWTSRNSFDLYFSGVVKGDASPRPTGRLPAEPDVAAIDKIMSRTDKLVRFPLRAAGAVVKSEAQYQRLVLRYWATIQRLMQSHVMSRLRRRGRELIRPE